MSKSNKKAVLLFTPSKAVDWCKVSHEEFHKSFNIHDAEIYESHTLSSQNYAMTAFSMDGEQVTHKTVHENGVNNWPDFYVNRAAKKLSGTVSIKGSEM